MTSQMMIWKTTLARIYFSKKYCNYTVLGKTNLSKLLYFMKLTSRLELGEDVDFLQENTVAINL